MTKSSSNRKRLDSGDSQEREERSAADTIDPAMKAEIEAAVGFLTDFLVKAPKQKFSPESVDLFRRSLQAVLCRRYQGHWHSTMPLKGSGFRCLRINGKLDPLVELAAEVSRLPLRKVRQAFPAELTVWVDPGDVSVRFGEEGSVGVFYESARRACNEDEQQQQPQQHAYAVHQRSCTPPTTNFSHHPQQQRVQFQSSPIQYRQQSSPVWNPHWQQPQSTFSPQRSSPSSTPPTNNNGFVMALNHQQQQMQLRQTPIRYNVSSSPSSNNRLSPQLMNAAGLIVEPTTTGETGEEQRCKMLAERLMRENLNLMASLAPGLVSSRQQPVGVGVN